MRRSIDNVHGHARALLAQFNVGCPADIRLEAFAAHMNARIVEAPLDGAEAQLVRTPRRATITLSTRVTDLVARRFNLAHELGHLALAHPAPKAAELACSPQRQTTSRGFESEASAWGSEVLLPEALVRPYCDVASVDLDVPHRIASDFTVSILAAAIRFTQLTDARCAAVFSVDGKVKWCATSKRFTPAIKRGKPLEHTSVAYDYFATGELDDRAQGVPADAWFTTDKDVEIIEHAVCRPKFRSVLSMLWIPEPVAAELGLRG